MIATACHIVTNGFALKALEQATVCDPCIESLTVVAGRNIVAAAFKSKTLLQNNK
jgi:hypothetical protein